MSQPIDIMLFEELMRLPREMRRMIMGDRFPEKEMPMRHPMPHGAPETGHMMRHGHGGHPHPMAGFHPHGNRPFARERVMQALLDYEDGARQKELAETMRVNPSSMSELIDKLQAEGYIERTVDPEDRRATRITLTELGKARAYEISDEREERIHPLFANLTDDEKQELLRLIRKLGVSAEN